MVNKPIKGSPISGETQEPDPTMPVNWFVPVTKQETWTLARQFEALPLTAAVADHVHNQALVVQKPVSPELKDFPTYCKRLERYASTYGQSIVSGAHKIWALSNFGRNKDNNEMPSVNYGFHFALKGSAKQENAGKHRIKSPLNNADVIQGLEDGHNQLWWDYSQLLQLMRAPDGISLRGKRFTLREALTNGLAPLWDEESPLRPELLP
jgi:hypothetical protein